MLTANFRTPQAVNKAMKNGIIIQGKRVTGDKPFYGAPRCFVCQGFGHFAASCNKKEAGIVCATCAGSHHREQCPTRERRNYKCVNCNTQGHATWDPHCPAFKIEVEKAIQKNNEIRYKYYVTKEEWTREIDPVYGWNPKHNLSNTFSPDQSSMYDKEDGEIEEDEDVEEEDNPENNPHEGSSRPRDRTTSQSTLDPYIKKWRPYRRNKEDDGSEK